MTTHATPTERMTMTADPTADHRAQLLDALDFAYCQGLGYDTPEALVAAYDAERGVSVPPPADQTALRQRIAEALYTHNHPGWATRYSDLDQDERDTYLARADAVLAVLPEQTDRNAVLLEAADDLATAFGDPMAKHIGLLGAAYLRRRARAGQAAEAQPETPTEKRLRYSERRNDELRAECKRRGKNVLEQSLKIVTLERQLDEVRSQLGAEVMRAGQAEAELRRVAAEEQAAADEVDVDLTDGPVRCPLCPNTVTLHTPSGARAHFTAVHPEQRITGRGPGPWPLLVTDGDEAHPDAARPAVGEQPANVHDAAQQPSAERPRCPHCQLPHDLTPDSLPAAVCASTRQRIADAAQAHTVGDHSGCCRVDCDVLQAVGEQPETQEADRA